MLGQVKLATFVAAQGADQINGIEVSALGEHLFLAGIIQVNL